MNSNHAINYPPESEKDFGKSVAFLIYEAVHNDAVMKKLYHQRTNILDNHKTPQVIYNNGTWTANLFSNEEAAQLEKINNELQERYEAIIENIHGKLSA